MSAFEQLRGFADLGEGHRELTQSDEERLRIAGEKLLAAGFGVESEDEDDGEEEVSEEGEDVSERESTHQSEVVDQTPESVIRSLVELSLRKWSRAVDMLTEKILDLEKRLEDTEEKARQSAKEAEECSKRAIAAEAKVASLVRSIEISEKSAKANALDLAKLRREAAQAPPPVEPKPSPDEAVNEEAKEVAKDLYTLVELAKTTMSDMSAKVGSLTETADQLEERILELRDLRPASPAEEEIFSDIEDEEVQLAPEGGTEASRKDGEPEEEIWDYKPASQVGAESSQQPKTNVPVGTEDWIFE